MDLVHVEYEQSGKSKSSNAFGMREMQEKACQGIPRQNRTIFLAQSTASVRQIKSLNVYRLG